MKYYYKDVATDEYGDLLITESGDLTMLKSNSAISQIIEHRLQTETQELVAHPSLGNRLRELLGQRLSPEMIQVGKMSLYSLLQYDGLLDPQDVDIEAIPISKNKVIYTIRVMNGLEEVYTTEIVVDTENGIQRSDT